MAANKKLAGGKISKIGRLGKEKPTEYDVVYVVSGPTEELRYSLRSVQKYAVGLRNVVVVGGGPGFLSEEDVVFIPAKDEFPTDMSNKDRNQWAKLEKAVLDPRVCERFLFAADDYLLTRPSRWEDFEPRQTGEADEKYMSAVPANDWQANRRATLRRFGSRRKWLWCPHQFAQISKRDFPAASEAADWRRRGDVTFHTFYYNWLGSKPVADYDTSEYHVPEQLSEIPARQISYWDPVFHFRPFREWLDG